MEHHEVKHQKGISAPVKILFAILLVAELAASVFFMLALVKLNLLQTWQILLAGGVLAILFIINTCVLIVRKKGVVSKVLSAILAILAIGACILGSKYVRTATSFIETATGSKYETQAYKVVTLTSSIYDDIDTLRGQRIGFLSSNPNISNTKAALKKTIGYKEASYEELGNLISALYEQDAAGIVLNDSYLDYLYEESDDTTINFAEETRVIYEFEVRADIEDIHDEVDITTEPFIIYVSGSDSRGAISQTARSDVNIVVAVNPKTNKILLVSIPRDYYVQLHGTTGTLDKLTHAGVYGIEMSKNTIEDLLGIKINYTVKVGFQAVKQIVDAIDGIDIDSDQALSIRGEDGTMCNIQQGKNHLNGACALRYSRERHSYTTGDRHRGQNQQQVLTKIIQKITDLHYATRWPQILEAAKGTFETSLTYDEITNFARLELATLKKWSIESIQLDGTGSSQPTYSMGSRPLYVMIPNQATVDNAKAKITETLADPVVEEPEETEEDSAQTEAPSEE
ncbi:LCP family protein [Candidatus Saccharibacteria bacterium]|nr:LCP family protein [Candidatus Saccharibacteria bacterium]